MSECAYLRYRATTTLLIVVVVSIVSVAHYLVFSCAWFRYRDPLTGKIYTSVDSSYTVRLFKVRVFRLVEMQQQQQLLSMLLLGCVIIQPTLVVGFDGRCSSGGARQPIVALYRI